MKGTIMAYQQKNRDEHLCSDNLPKRILTLDGGGIKGVLTLGILKKIEEILGERYGNSDSFRLCHYFDLISGTSTGAIIAAALAIGWSVDQLREKYMSLGERVFERSLFRQGLLRAKYDHAKLDEELKSVFGGETMLRSSHIHTGLLIITKRLDTGSPWPISNNPRGKYFNSRPGGTIGNGDYPLWKVVRASTAAPAYFDSETITIVEKSDHQPTTGLFVDGGVSPFNNPALQTFMYATMDGYRIGWPTGFNKLLLVSVGTGDVNPEIKRAGIAAKQAVSALLSLMDDCAALQETMLQWLSSSPTARQIDREIGDLRYDLVSGTPLLTYLRYNADLRQENVQRLNPSLTDMKQIESLSAMDAPENMDVLYKLGALAADQEVKGRDFTSVFDLV
jgi:predicted acylesterase/phospholipase RssA